MKIVKCAPNHFIEDGSRSHRDIVCEEVLGDVTPFVTPSNVSIFSAPPYTSVDQNLDPMPDVDWNFPVVPPPTATPPRRSVRERRSTIFDDYVIYSIECDLSDLADPINYNQAMNNRFAV